MMFRFLGRSGAGEHGPVATDGGRRGPAAGMPARRRANHPRGNLDRPQRTSS